MKKSVSHVPALARGLKILEWMASREEPAKLTQIAQGLGLGIPEVQRPVACLEETGYLRQLASGAYVLSGKLYGVASYHPPQLRLRRAAEPALLEFAASTGQSIHLSVPDGDAALMILDVPGSGLIRLSLRAGARFCPENTLSGAMLAAADAIARPRGFRPAPALKKAVVAGTPYSRKSGQVEGVTDLGILLRDGEKRVLGVVAASVINLRGGSVNQSELTTSLLQTGARLQETL